MHYKEAVSLVRAGFEVTHIAPGDINGQVVDGVKFVCFKGRSSVRGRVAQMRTLYRLARQVKADVYHCNEVESWTVGVFLKLRDRMRVVFDVHEIYSTRLSERFFIRSLRPALGTLVKLYFRLLLPFTDRLVFAKKSVQKDFPKNFKKIVLVQNFVEADVAHRLPLSKTGKSLNNGKIVALHLGAINRARGWPQFVESLARVKNSNLHISVVGRFGDGTEDQFKKEVLRFGLSHRVEFVPWIPYEDVPDYAAACQIGMITFQPVHDNFVHALPHKLFDYMLARLPVIVPDFAVEVADIVRDSQCGILVDTTKPEDIARAMDRLAADPDLRFRMGRKGHDAVMKRYNWEHEAKELIAMYQGLGPSRGLL